MGGLGNQMFQYAAARALALRLGLELALDLTWFEQEHDCARREYSLGIFSHAGMIASPAFLESWERRENNRLHRRLRKLFGNRFFWRMRRVSEPHFHYWPGFEGIAGSVRLEGYWQSERYFAAYADAVRRDFTFPSFPAGPAFDLARNIREADGASVSIHVRRGDYVSDATVSAVHGSCPPEYYQKSLARIAQEQGERLRLFLFSDDPAWMRAHFDTCGHEAEVVDLCADPVHDMHLMSLCRHHVIANSSFSWWGAWLGGEGGITCAPGRWFATAERDTRDLIPERWRRIG